ncbi:MAG: hypothetical protein E7B11_25060, partial [Clostridiales bacterium]|nr:hypothetical protein [Clostridiales bacterium]MDU3243829.1 hypothetical protein [Clostridiales bacterium]
LNILNTPFSLFYHKMGMQNICFVQLLIFKHALGTKLIKIPLAAEAAGGLFLYERIMNDL